MGLLSRLKKHSTAVDAVALDTVLIEPDGNRVSVVGESFQLDALEAITGRRGEEEIRQPVVAVLLREPDNPYDAHAVAVYVEGRMVGHLSREDARAYQPVLLTLASSQVLGCNAHVCGREGTPDLGVVLDLPAADDILK